MLSLSSVYIDPKSPPTIFELSMCSSLSASLQPAFDFTLNIVADNSPLVRRAVAIKDECFLMLMFLVERSYLQASESSFEENFYGLRRAALDGSLISPAQKLSSMVELVALPYVLKKLAVAMHRLDAENPAALVIRMGLTAMEIAVLAFQAAYVIGQSRFYSPLHYLQGFVLARLTAEDVQRLQRKAAASLGVGWGGGVLDKAKYLLSQGLGALRSSLVLAAFVFRLAQLYESPENRARREAMKRGSNALLVPPPPVPLPLTAQGALMVRDPNVCPLCSQPRKLPATSSSGHCFCYVSCLLFGGR